MKRVVPALLCTLLAACGGDDDGDGDSGGLFDEKPECEGAAIVPLEGDQQMVMSFLEIGERDDGLDLDLDGEPDNQLSGIADLTRDSIADSFADFDIILPLEFFDFPEAAADDCVKFAFYVGAYRQDRDGDGGETAGPEADCNDDDENVFRGAVEQAGNFYDDDCDGLADEDGETPSVDAEDRDQDGLTIAAGDCDDTRDTVGAGPEVCGDGLDNDCDGSADWGLDGTTPVCSPYDDTPDALSLEPDGFVGGEPVIAFRAATVTDEGGVLVLEAGPSLFSINIPVSGDIGLDLRLSGASIRAEVVTTPGGVGLMNGQLGGVIDANTADKIRGLEAEEIDLKPEDSLLDAIFANILGVFLALPKSMNPDFPNCLVPDIDADQDGLEIFCDSNPDDTVKAVDICVDGDGTVIMDEGATQCSEATNADGSLRFVDGISVEFNFAAVPAVIPGPLP